MKTRRPSIKPVSREPDKKKAASLRDCRCFDEVERRIRMGWASAKVVEMIQEEYGELTNLSAKYVKKMVDEFRRSIPAAELVLSTRNPLAAKHANARLANGLNELGELERLYKLQMQRIDMQFGNEENITTLLPGTGREIYYAMKILKESANLKMELGIAKRQASEVSITGQTSVQIANRYGSEEVGTVLTDPDSRRRVLGMVKTLVALGDKAGVDAAMFVNSAAETGGIDERDVIDVPMDDDQDDHEVTE